VSGFAQTAASGPLFAAVAVAALAGLVSFLAPCMLPLVPGYLSYVTGLAATDAATATGQRRHVGRATAGSALFVAGFTAVFVLLAYAAGTAGAGAADPPEGHRGRRRRRHYRHGVGIPRCAALAGTDLASAPAAAGRAGRGTRARRGVRPVVDAVPVAHADRGPRDLLSGTAALATLAPGRPVWVGPFVTWLPAVRRMNATRAGRSTTKSTAGAGSRWSRRIAGRRGKAETICLGTAITWAAGDTPR